MQPAELPLIIVPNLEHTNGSEQTAKHQHDISTTSPRRDGVGFSKAGIDLVPGNTTLDALKLETNNAITSTEPGTKVIKLMAEKVQTGISVKIADVTFTVGS